MKRDIKSPPPKTGKGIVEQRKKKEEKKKTKDALENWRHYLAHRHTQELIEYRKDTMVYKVSFIPGTDIPDTSTLLKLVGGAYHKGVVTPIYSDDTLTSFEVQIWKD